MLVLISSSYTSLHQLSCERMKFHFGNVINQRDHSDLLSVLLKETLSLLSSSQPVNLQTKSSFHMVRGSGI